MKTFPANVFILLLSAFSFAAEPKYQPLPMPLSNNAVASVKVKGSLLLLSFMGIGSRKTWNSITNSAYSMDTDTGKWLEIRSVPGTVGRIAASAVGAREEVFLFGGYLVDAQGGEATVPDLNVYEPQTDRWYRGADIPIPVDDSVVAVYRDRYIYLIGGWSKTNAVADVQIYDAEKDRWMKGTSAPGTPVFGHAGGIVGDTIVFVDGAHINPSASQPKYVPVEQAWTGKIDHKDPTKITWSKLPEHPGNARYRIAAGSSDKDGKVYFSGGTDNPYNYNGIGYNGQPSEPSPVTFALNVKTGKWETVHENTPDPTMDNRGLLAIPQGLVTIGGMEKGQQVTATVRVISRRAKSK
jgi:N-acetylneuraminic acid mutarotase